MLTQLTGNAVWDGIGSIVVGVTLFAVAYFLARKTKHLLIGQSVAPAQRRRMIEIVEQSPGVAQLLHLRTMHLGPDSLLVAAKIDYDHSLSVEDLAAAIDRTEADLRGAVPLDAVIYIEPDIRRKRTE